LVGLSKSSNGSPPHPFRSRVGGAQVRDAGVDRELGDERRRDISVSPRTRLVSVGSVESYHDAIAFGALGTVRADSSRLVEAAVSLPNVRWAGRASGGGWFDELGGRSGDVDESRHSERSARTPRRSSILEYCRPAVASQKRQSLIAESAEPGGQLSRKCVAKCWRRGSISLGR